MLGIKHETPEERRARSRELDRIYAEENARFAAERAAEDRQSFWQRLAGASWVKGGRDE